MEIVLALINVHSTGIYEILLCSYIINLWVLFLEWIYVHLRFSNKTYCTLMEKRGGRTLLHSIVDIQSSAKTANSVLSTNVKNK